MAAKSLVVITTLKKKINKNKTQTKKPSKNDNNKQNPNQTNNKNQNETKPMLSNWVFSWTEREMQNLFLEVEL